MWPDDRDLPVEVQAVFGADLTADPGSWSWTDLSDRLRNTPISIRVPDAQFSPGTCSVTLINDDSALSPLHPMSPYWPNVELGTPLRVRVRHTEDAFGRTVSNGWGAADSGQVWAVRNGPASAFSTSAGVGRHSHTTVNTLRRITLPTSLLDAEQVVDVAPSVLLTGAALVTGLIFRYSNGGSDYYWLRAEFNSGGTSVMLKIAKCVGGAFTDIASLNPVPGVPYAANTYLRVRASVVGSRLAIKVWNPAGAEPAGWQLTATDTAIAVPGGTGVQSWLVGGNTNTLPVTALHKSYTVRVDRFSGFADQWEPTYMPITTGESASAVRITCSGILRRLTQGSPPSRSAMRRTLAASGALAYWPVEDGSSAGQAASAFAGHAPLSIAGPAPKFDDIESWTEGQGFTVRYGTAALADLSAGSILSAPVPVSVSAATGAGWTVGAAVDVPDGTLSAELVLLEVETTGGTFARWRMVIGTDGHTRVIAYDSGGAATTVVDDPSVRISMFLHNFAVWQSGGTISAGFRWDSVAGYEGVGSVAGTLGGVTRVTVNVTGATSSVPVLAGHIVVWAGHDLPVVDQRDGAAVLALLGYEWFGNATAATAPSGEPATVRLARLAAEDGVTLDMPVVAITDEVMMGRQGAGTPLDLYQECVDADMGVLYERGFGLAYVPRVYRYNKTVDMTVDLAAYAVSGQSGGVLSPAYDDQQIRNEITVERRDGSSVVVSDPDSQSRNGVYTESVELNLATDGQLLDQASWRLHLGAVNELREANFPLDLAANPVLVDGWLSCGAGSRIVRTNPPSQYPPGSLDRLVEGWTETIGPRSWLVQVTPSPAESWDVATVDGPQRVTADGSTLAAAVTATATTLSLATTSTVSRWTTDPADFPLDLNVNGEQVTVSAISGTGSPQTATVAARSVNGVVKAHAAGAPVDVWQPAVLAL